MLTSQPGRGGVALYSLITPVCDLVQTRGESQTAAPAERVLTPEAQDDRDDFEAQYGNNGDCSCHVSAPCGSCMHPGNPMQQENNDACWMAAGDSEGGETDAPAWATDPALQYLAPEDYEMPPADPALLAMANRELSHQLSHIATTCAEYLPNPSDITTVRAVEIMDMRIDAQRAHADSLINAHVSEIRGAQAQLKMIVLKPLATSLLDHAKEAVKAHQVLFSEKNIAAVRGHTINQMRLEAGDLRERLDAVTQQSIANTVAMTEKNTRLAADLKDMTRERDLLKAENLALKTSEDATTGFITELQALRTSRANAINEA